MRWEICYLRVSIVPIKGEVLYFVVLPEIVHLGGAGVDDEAHLVDHDELEIVSRLLVSDVEAVLDLASAETHFKIEFYYCL